MIPRTPLFLASVARPALRGSAPRAFKAVPTVASRISAARSVTTQAESLIHHEGTSASSSHGLGDAMNVTPDALLRARVHPRTHNIPVAVIHFRSHQPERLTFFLHFVMHAAYGLGIPASQPAALPTQRSLYTVLKGPFVHKKSQENFESKVHKRAVKLWDADPEVVRRLLTYLEENMLPGVGMKVVNWERVEFGWGEKMEEELATMKRNIPKIGGGVVEAEESASVEKQVMQKVEEIVKQEMKAAGLDGQQSSPTGTPKAKPSSEPRPSPEK